MALPTLLDAQLSMLISFGLWPQYIPVSPKAIFIYTQVQFTQVAQCSFASLVEVLNASRTVLPKNL